MRLCSWGRVGVRVTGRCVLGLVCVLDVALAARTIILSVDIDYVVQ